MALTKEQKKKVTETLRERIEKQKIVVFCAIEGIKVKEISNLREKLKSEDCLLNVAKKTLFGRVLKEKNIDINMKNVAGQTALIFGFKDETAAPRIAFNFSRENQNFRIMGGIFGAKGISKEEIEILAQIPSKNQLLANFVRAISSPVAGLINVMEGNIKGLMYALSNIKK